MKKQILLLSAVCLLASCASSKKENNEIVGQPSELYSKGMDSLYAKKYATAINTFEELDRQHPYSKFSKKGQVMTVFAQFEKEDYDEAIYSADRFIQSNIGYKDLDYVYYMKGLSYYYRISDIKREQSNTEKAVVAFQELINRFPKSKYAKSAEQKIIFCYDHLAGKEMEVGRFYQNQGNMISAINRFQTVVTSYQKSTHTPEALYRVAESYISIGIETEAVRALSILGYNYSGDSKWYKKGYDLLTNINDYEKKYNKEAWYAKFKDGVNESFK